MAKKLDLDKLAAWQQRLQRFQAGELTVARFSQQENVSLASYYYWSRRVQESCSSAAASASPPSRAPVEKLSNKKVAPAAIEIWLHDCVRVLVPTGCTEALRLVLHSALLGSDSSRGGTQTPAFQQVLVDAR
jgi:hypothetical protein